MSCNWPWTGSVPGTSPSPSSSSSPDRTPIPLFISPFTIPLTPAVCLNFEETNIMVSCVCLWDTTTLIDAVYLPLRNAVQFFVLFYWQLQIPITYVCQKSKYSICAVKSCCKSRNVNQNKRRVAPDTENAYKLGTIRTVLAAASAAG